MGNAIANALEPVFATITVKRTVTMEAVKSALCTAFEGGVTANYARIVDYVLPEGTTQEDFEGGGRFNGSGSTYWTPDQIIPTHDGGALKIVIESPRDDFKDEWSPGHKKQTGVNYVLLTKEKIVKGLEIFAKNYPKQFSEEFPEDRDDYGGDAITGDMFFQCCIMPDDVEKSGMVFG